MKFQEHFKGAVIQSGSFTHLQLKQIKSSKHTILSNLTLFQVGVLWVKLLAAALLMLHLGFI